MGLSVIKLQEKYTAKCCICGARMWLAPSPRMRGGVNSGSAECNDCGTTLHLKICPDLSGDIMATEIWGKHLTVNCNRGSFSGGWLCAGASSELNV